MLRWLTSGESHGRALVGILEGIPAGLELSEGYVDRQLARRQLGYGRGGRMRIERDRARILSGVRFGRTLGSPICILVENRDWENWKEAMSVGPGEAEPVTVPRPGHADLAGLWKYGHEDVRNVLERASARETAVRVALGAVARRFLEEFGVEIGSFVVSVGGVSWEPPEGFFPGEEVDSSPLRCPDPEAERRMMEEVDEAGKAGDSVGGVFQVVARGVPPGLGSYSQAERRLEARLAAAVMGIPAIKGVEVGLGFRAAGRRGSEVHDGIFLEDGRVVRRTNRAGGIEGGVSNGQPIVLRAAMKPIPTLRKPLPSVDMRDLSPTYAHKERSDVCAVPAAAVVAEAAVALVLADAFLEKFGGDSLDECERNFEGYIGSLRGW